MEIIAISVLTYILFIYKNTVTWIFYALMSALFAALTAIFAKLGLANISSNLATAIRTVVVLIMVWGIVFLKGQTKGIGSVSRSTMIFLIISGISTGLSWLFYFKALQIGKVSQVAPVDKLSVALVIILSVFFLKESLSVKTAVGAGLIVAGTVLIALK